MRGRNIVSGAIVACVLVGVAYGCASQYVVEGADAGPRATDLPDATATATATGTNDGAVGPRDAEVDPDGALRPRCAPGAAFGPPEVVTELSTAAGEPAATLADDELTIYFSRNGNLMVATRPSREVPFTNVRAAGLSGGGTDDNPALTLDGRRLFFTAIDRGDSGASEIFVAQVTDAGLAAPAAVRGIAPESTDPFPTADAAALYFSGERDGGASDLWLATGLGGAVVEQRLPLSDPTTSDGQPVLSRDELTLFYGTRRTGTVGLTDVFVATRLRTSEAFANPVALGPIVNSAGNDLPLWISSDGCVLYFTSDRPGGPGGRDLYRTTRGR